VLNELLLKIWREAGRHVELVESVENLARLVATEIPADLLAVRRVDLARRQLETMAAGACRPAVSRPVHAWTTCDPDMLRQVVDWCHRGACRTGTTEDPLLATLMPAGLSGGCLAAPLETGEAQYGVLVLWRDGPGTFLPRHERVAERLREPLGVAFANDLRLHELARLREALEADKRALLTRLGRRELGDTIVGADSGLRDVMQRVEQVAPTDAPVLLLGETGTGKEAIARAIHVRSHRATGPIMRVNCGALPPGLIDSELFGHERGSFTGAVGTRKGWFERAHGGTLFLDEVAELPLDAQVRLLRIVQDGTFERVGSEKPLTADVRIVAATNRDLRAMVTRGAFREDLWYRLAVFPIHIPALRDRPEDIPALAAHFAARAGIRLGGARLAPTPEDIDLLLGYDWPGNVREFSAVIERAAILGNGRELRLAPALGLSRAAAAPAPGPDVAPVRDAAANGAPDGRNGPTLDAAMRHTIETALADCFGRVEGPFGAARRLGINPHTLRARMRKLGIDWARYRGRD
jgi:transcriptional regulator with GAF, ATPase, and Fis domain